ncbi:MAG: hypothetical protein HOL98_06015 [Gammaproteobacteria bacterium]|jgi:hypothetical protein|nr:hypothetical protein [Gammaproteobacteria bacterium]MBT5202997.1 hypothetical protein [Gammaproteobacteria bacterium]MBT5602974.1 hypothetical protein [Gammaproteobacteria bacterium]MBT6244402.1 hypothetical protein [Gammaproteobacteria bacterium]
MKSFAFGFAYVLIYTTPIQVLYLLWIGWVIMTTEHGLLSLSTSIFLEENISFLYHWLYSWFWQSWLDFWWGFPAIMLGGFKLVGSTLFGWWLLNVARKMD